MKAKHKSKIKHRKKSKVKCKKKARIRKTKTSSKLVLYNTLTRKKDIFKPLKKDLVTLYSCGPTVYWYQHIGNLRTYIFVDLLKRVLKYNGYKTRHVMNITDVGHLTSDQDTGEDRMIIALKREGLSFTKESMLKIAERYTNLFKQDLRALNIEEPDIFCNATSHIQEMQELIQRIEKRGYSYIGENGNVYFDTAQFKNYGKLARLKLKELKAGARIEIDKEKKNPRDFVLWFSTRGSKFKEHLLKWKSPWGEGWPGWHLECSAMSMKYLGEHFDIHVGGEEHIPVHHTNEIAQSEAATGKKFVNYWIHTRWLVFKGEKMSKSKGDIYTVSELKNKGYDALAYRYLCLTAHYRTQLEFTWQNLGAAQNAFNSLKNKILEIKENLEVKDIRSEKTLDYKKEFLKFINDDINMPKAIALFWKMLKDKNLQNNEKYALILNFDKIFALGLDKVKREQVTLPEKIRELIKKREEARKNKNFDLADKLREEIKQNGFIIEDADQKTIVKKA